MKNADDQFTKTRRNKKFKFHSLIIMITNSMKCFQDTFKCGKEYLPIISKGMIWIRFMKAESYPKCFQMIYVAEEWGKKEEVYIMVIETLYKNIVSLLTYQNA